jgi:hypothetical protein
MYLEPNIDARERSLKGACESNRWVWDEDMILKPVNRVAGVFKYEWIVN